VARDPHSATHAVVRIEGNDIPAGTHPLAAETRAERPARARRSDDVVRSPGK